MQKHTKYYKQLFQKNWIINSVEIWPIIPLQEYYYTILIPIFNMLDDQIYKTVKILIKNQLTNQENQQITTFRYQQSNHKINITYIFQLHKDTQPQVNNSHIFLSDSQKKTYNFLGIYPKEQIVIDLQHVKNLKEDDTLFFSFKSINQENNQVQEVALKEKRKQRTISQAKTLVKSWKYYYEGNKLQTKETAAKKVGISKKTLADYQKYLTKGEQWKFSFNNEDSKMGQLRKFVDNIQQQVGGYLNTNKKLNKMVKIINFDHKY